MENIDNFKERMKVYCDCLNRDMKKNGVRIIGEPIVDATFDLSVLGMNLRFREMPNNKYFKVIVTDNKHANFTGIDINIPQSSISNLNSDYDTSDRRLVLLGVKITGSYTVEIHLKKDNGYTTKKEYTMENGLLLPDVDGFVRTIEDREDDDDEDNDLSMKFDMSTPNMDAYQEWYDRYVKENQKTIMDSNEFNWEKNRAKGV